MLWRSEIILSFRPATHWWSWIVSFWSAFCKAVFIKFACPFTWSSSLTWFSELSSTPWIVHYRARTLIARIPLRQLPVVLLLWRIIIGIGALRSERTTIGSVLRCARPFLAIGIFACIFPRTGISTRAAEFKAAIRFPLSIAIVGVGVRITSGTWRFAKHGSTLVLQY